MLLYLDECVVCENSNIKLYECEKCSSLICGDCFFDHYCNLDKSVRKELNDQAKADYKREF